MSPRAHRLFACTVNVQGLATRPAKLHSLYKALTSRPFSLAILTESNLSASLLSKPSHSPPQSLHAFTSRNPDQALGSGVTVIAAHTVSISDFQEPIPGHLVQFSFTTPFLSAFALGVYSPPGNTTVAQSIVTHITESLETPPHANLLLLGDLNATFRQIDRMPFFLSAHDRIWRDFIQSVRLHDAIDRFHPSTPKFTHTTRSSQARLDHVFVSPSLLPALESADIQGGLLKQGDHYAATICLRPVGPSAFCSSIPRTPTQDIRDTPFCVQAQALLESLKPQSPAPPSSSKEAWVLFLSTIDMLSRAATNYTRGKATHLRRLITHLQQRLATARDQPPSGSRAQHFESESSLNSLLAQYEHDLAARKATLLNKVAGFDADECDYTVRLLANARLNDVDRSATSFLHPSSGVYVHSTSEMLDACRTFYRDLLGEQDTRAPTPDVSVFPSTLPHLTPSQQQALLAPVTLKEARDTIRALRPRKAPGPDGVPNDLYRAFGDLLAPHLQPVLEAFLRDPWLPPQVQGVVITPLYKGEGDRRDLSTWRPISLVNSTYKLIALFLMRRMNPTMSSLVSPGQTNAVPGRTTFDNVHCARLAQFAAASYEVDVSFAYIDCVKAFDRVEWPYLWATLAAMHVPPSFIACIKALYADATASVRVNGFLSNTFPLGRGVRQGCPLSPLLYVLALEPIRLFMNNLSSDRPHEWLPDGFPASLAHADDLSFIAWSDLVLQHLARIQTFASSRLHSGFLISIAKTFILYMCRDSIPTEQELNRNGTPYRCHYWLDDHGKKHLGLATGGIDSNGQALATACERARAKLGVFGPCTLPLLQKARLLVSRYAGSLQYYAQTIPFPTATQDQLVRDVERAFWGPFRKHQHFVRGKRLFFPVSLGGAGLIHPPSWFDAFHRTRLVRLCQALPRPCDDREHPPVLADPCLVITFKFLIKNLGHEFSFDPATFFWQPRNIRTTIASRFPAYWREVFSYFEREIAYEHTLLAAISETRTEFLDIPYALHKLQVPFPAASAAQLQSLADKAADIERDGRGWPDLITQPAYMVPFAIDPGPRRSASRRPTSRKVGGPVKYHYQIIQTARMNMNPWAYSAENDWVDAYPTLQGDPDSDGVEGGRIGMPAHEKDRMGKMLRFCHGQRYGYPLSHAWLLFQARLDPPYFPCPWCGLASSAFASHFKRFLHVAWSCPVFQRHWASLRTRARLRSIPFISDLAIGLAPDGEARIPENARLRGITLHAAMWRILNGHSSTRSTPGTYDDVLGYFKHCLSKPAFFEDEVDPTDPQYLRQAVIDPG